MSAIWGVIYKMGETVSEKIHQSVIRGLSIYKLDLIKSWYKNNVYLGCGLQYITPQSLQEILPYYDKKKGIAITADAIIDNREELFNLLNISVGDRNKVTDSELILACYEKWGTDCPKYLIGDFAFSIWNEKKQEIFCARDQVGTRTLYYYHNKDVFIFGTVMKAILNILKDKPNLNERWIADFLALPLVIHESECNETIYNNIYQLPPAHTITINDSGVKNVKYWNPIKEVKVLKLKTDQDYEDAFKEVFFQAVHCRTCSLKNIGIMLSGGMDSGSVASVAAMQLADENRRLKAFSSIPIRGFRDDSPRYNIADESEYIQSLSDSFNNIDITYCRSEGKNSFTDIDFLIDILEQPHKIIENLFWVNSLTEMAANHECKVFLNGAYGNLTISYGDFKGYILTLFRLGKLIKLVREIKETSELYKISKARIIKDVFKVIMPYKLRKDITYKKYKNFDDFDMVPANMNLLNKWNVKERLKEKGYFLHPDVFYDMKETREYMLDAVMLNQMSSIETKISLAHGIVTRDPTRDKRLIELCMSMPYDQFVRNGKERYLVFRAMKGILPDKIRLNKLRGLQSADWIQRLQPEWKKIHTELEQMLNNENIKKYIDVCKVEKQLIYIGDNLNEKKSISIRMLLVSLIMEHFIQHYAG